MGLPTPYLNGVPRFEKPILFYWTQAAAVSVFGDHEFAARLPSALGGVGIVFLLYLIGVEIASRRAAFVAALVLSTMFRFVTFARIGLTDVPVMFFIVAALYGCVRAISATSPKWMAFAWSCVGLGVLTKGPVGLLPVPIWVAYAALSRDRSLFARTRPLLGLVLTVAIALPWYVVMAVEHGRAFTDFALGHEVVQRMLSEESFAPTRGFFYYFKVWPGDAAPWSVLFLARRGLDGVAVVGTRQQDKGSGSLRGSMVHLRVPRLFALALEGAALRAAGLSRRRAASGVFVDRLADTRDDVLWWGVPTGVIAIALIVAAGATGLFLQVLAPGDMFVNWLVPGVLGVGGAAIALATWRRTLVVAVYALAGTLAAVFSLSACSSSRASSNR